MHKVIIIPGLGDHIRATQKAVSGWGKSGLYPVIFAMHWYDEENFETKLRKLGDVVDSESRDGSTVSVIGCSAGASAALNLFAERSAVLKRAVSICGRLKDGDHAGFRSLAIRGRKSQSFRESVKLFEHQELSLTQDMRHRIMTIRPRFGDELIPTDTAILKGAYNITIPTLGHSFSIYMSLSVLSKPLISFLKS